MYTMKFCIAVVFVKYLSLENKTVEKVKQETRHHEDKRWLRLWQQERRGLERHSPLNQQNGDNNVWCTALTSIGQQEMFFIPKIAGPFEQNNLR